MESGMEIQRAARTVYLIGEVPAQFLSKAEEHEVLDEGPGDE
jgi:RNA:NAD 2'-phosphotransferase (TPT1/KptA family)